MDQNGNNELNNQHPNPDRWWRTIKYQSWTCLFAMIGEIFLLFYFPVGENIGNPLMILNVGLVGGFISYNGGSALIDMIKAWRSK